MNRRLTGMLYAEPTDEGALLLDWCDDLGAPVRPQTPVRLRDLDALGPWLDGEGITSRTVVVGDPDGDGDRAVEVFTDQLDYEDVLRQAGMALSEARGMESAALERIFATIPLAIAAGTTEVEAARLAQVDRMTVRKALGKR